jgi:hypothetical protein
MAQFPAPEQGVVVTHLIVSDDVERSRRFYTEGLVGETVSRGEPIYVALANSWIIINIGVGLTEDKPTVILETPPVSGQQLPQHPGLRTSRRCTRSGARGAPSFSRHRSRGKPRSAATSAIRLAYLIEVGQTTVTPRTP